MSVNSISGNQNFNKINNTVVTPSAVYDALLNSQGPVGIKTILGTTNTLGATGFYTVIDLNGNPIQFQEGDFVMSTTISGHQTLTPETSTFEVSLAASVGGDPSTNLVGPDPATAVAAPNVNDGVTLVNTSTEVDDTDQWPVVAVDVDNVTAGHVEVVFSVIPLQL